jgi:WD40 repeat protein
MLSIMCYAFNSDEVINLLSSLSKMSVGFLIHNLSEIMRICRDSEERYQMTELKEINEHDAGVNQIIFISDDELATASHDFTIKIWDTKNYQL